MKERILELDPSEVVEFEIKRHPIGLVPIYATGVILTVLLLSLPIIVRFSGQASTINSIFGGTTSLIGIVALVVALLSAGATLVAAYVYKQNELVITSENLIQVLQFSLFNTKVSQLSLEKVQDVTASQNGIFARMFNYGTLYIETAGETANFGFPLAKDPMVSAKQINEAHERFIKKYGIDVV